MLYALEIENFKSLRDVSIHGFPPFAVLVGANAAGKSNFVDALDFLSTTMALGLPAAVSSRGGLGTFAFRHGGLQDARIRFRVMVESPMRAASAAGIVRYSFDYSFEIRPAARSAMSDHVVTAESLHISAHEVETDTPIAEAALIRTEGGLEVALPDSDEGRDYFDRLVVFEHARRDLPGLYGTVAPDELWMGPGSFMTHTPPASVLISEIANWSVYQFSPHAARQPCVLARGPRLGRHGDNLPAAVANMKRKHKAAFGELLEHLAIAVPTMQDVATEYLDTKQMGLRFQEEGLREGWLAHEVSDGTLQTLCMFLALLDPDATLVAIEEPETSVHPWILEHFIETCEEMSGEKQITLTTHSPTAVDAVPLDALHVVRKIGTATTIEPCSTRHPEVRDLIKERILRLGETWRRGLVGGVPAEQPGTFGREDEPKS